MPKAPGSGGPRASQRKRQGIPQKGCVSRGEQGRTAGTMCCFPTQLMPKASRAPVVALSTHYDVTTESGFRGRAYDANRSCNDNRKRRHQQTRGNIKKKIKRTREPYQYMLCTQGTQKKKAHKLHANTGRQHAGRQHIRTFFRSSYSAADLGRTLSSIFSSSRSAT